MFEKNFDSLPQSFELAGCVETPALLVCARHVFLIVTCLAYSFEVLMVKRNARVSVVLFVKIDLVMHDLSRYDQSFFEASFA